MRIRIDLTALQQVRWYEHLTRFQLGGLISVVADLIAKGFGPGVGGLFLAFPATIRGRLAVGLEARGAAMGSIALGRSRSWSGRCWPATARPWSSQWC